ncbi:MAG: multidrug efflux MFS transporter, partial [Mesorhizobium sp.]
ITAGALVGPLLGGALPPLIGIRATFLLAGGVIFLAFLATTLLIKEAPRPVAAKVASEEKTNDGWSQIPDKRPIVAMLATGMLLSFATMSIEPIITVYVQQLIEDQSQV